MEKLTQDIIKECKEEINKRFAALDKTFPLSGDLESEKIIEWNRELKIIVSILCNHIKIGEHRITRDTESEKECIFERIDTSKNSSEFWKEYYNLICPGLLALQTLLTIFLSMVIQFCVQMITI